MDATDNTMPAADGRAATAAILKEREGLREILQDVIIHPDGTVEIPWIDPAATPLVMEIWNAIGKHVFPVRIPKGERIYCG